MKKNLKKDVSMILKEQNHNNEDSVGINPTTVKNL